MVSKIFELIKKRLCIRKKMQSYETTQKFRTLKELVRYNDIDLN